VQTVNILNDVSFSIGRGEIFGLVGESGSGKTTLARTMLGLTKASGGTLRFNGLDATAPATQGELRRSVAMMFQDPMASLSPRMKVGALVTEPLLIHGAPMTNRSKAAAELLDRVGLSPAMAQRYPHELSGGQARRVCLARALALKPALVVADEPTAGLDVSVQGEVLNLMMSLRNEMKVSFLIITHNLAVVRQVTDRVAILYLGRLVETGSTPAVFRQPQHPYTQSLLASEPQPDPRKRRTDLAIVGEIPSVIRRPGGCEFHTRCRFAMDYCRQQLPTLRPVQPGHGARCHFAGDPTIIIPIQGGHHEH
jgi:peptide/nickel transport system ATP-binding protein